ncbi:MAG: CBS domain-containing protein [Alphaproteobacteria bacterium]|nr:CBS domain-containing protein [Alphaproteobacteria bacterium]
MTIQVILNTKGANVFAIDMSKSVRDALQLMDQHQIGALVVTGTKDRVGIFTERDVMRAIAQHDAKCLTEAVEDHMTTRPQVITPETSVEEAMAIMTERRFRHLPVMADNTLCGIISIGDLVNYRIRTTEAHAEALKEYITTG